MNATEYKKQAARTLLEKPDQTLSDKDFMIVWNVMGISGESGELADLIKKGIFHKHGLDQEKIKRELGDILWYIAGLCTTLDIDLSEVMQINIDKLKARFPDGYSSERTKVREGNAH